MSFHPCFSRQGNIPSHHIFTHACSLPHCPLPWGASALGGWDLSWPCSQSLVWMFHPSLPLCLRAEQPQAHPGVWNTEGEIAAPAPQWRIKEQHSVNSVMVGWG